MSEQSVAQAEAALTMARVGITDGHVKELVIQASASALMYAFDSMLDAMAMDCMDCDLKIHGDQLVMTLKEAQD